jgi:hypothetical protein
VFYVPLETVHDATGTTTYTQYEVEKFLSNIAKEEIGHHTNLHPFVQAEELLRIPWIKWLAVGSYKSDTSFCLNCGLIVFQQVLLLWIAPFKGLEKVPPQKKKVRYKRTGKRQGLPVS